MRVAVPARLVASRGSGAGGCCGLDCVGLDLTPGDRAAGPGTPRWSARAPARRGRTRIPGSAESGGQGARRATTALAPTPQAQRRLRGGSRRRRSKVHSRDRAAASSSPHISRQLRPGSARTRSYNEATPAAPRRAASTPSARREGWRAAGPVPRAELLVPPLPLHPRLSKRKGAGAQRGRACGSSPVRGGGEGKNRRAASTTGGVLGAGSAARTPAAARSVLGARAY